jgi:glycine oxidase
VVVGGGVVGCAVARALAREGLRPLVLERGVVGAEASRAAAGMVAPQAESHGPGALLAAGVASRRRWRAFAAAIEAESGVDVEYRRDGIVYVACTAPERARLERRMRWQRAAGLRVRRLGIAAARARVPVLARDVAFAVHFPDDHRVDNERLVGAVALAARRAGARIVEHAPARAIVGRRGRIDGVDTPLGRVATPTVVNAAGAWAGALRLPAGVAAPPVVPVRGQMLVLGAAPGALPQPLYSARAYLVPRSDGRVLVGSTLERGVAEKRVTLAVAARLLAAATAIAPGLADAALLGGYAGLRPGTSDGLPIVGRAPDVDGLVLAAGLYRSGILLAPLVAEAIAELIVRGRVLPDVAAFAPARFAATRGPRPARK